MELFVTKKVFNSNLNGKAIRVKGFDFEGERWNDIYLVKMTQFDHILITSRNGKEYSLDMELFEVDNHLTLTVLEEAE